MKQSELIQRLVDVLDAMRMRYTPTDDSYYLAARDILSKAEKAGHKPDPKGGNFEEFDKRPMDRFGLPADV